MEKYWLDLFSSGKFGELIQKFHQEKGAPQDWQIPLVVGSMAFKGDYLEATLLMQNEIENLDSVQKCGCLFYLALTEIRRSHYSEALKLIEQIETLHQREFNPESSFYFNQAQGFLLYYCGDRVNSQVSATESLRLALKIKKPFFRILAEDLLGHCKVMAGELNAGIKLIRAARELAISIGNSTWGVAALTSILAYEARHGYRSQTILIELSELLKDEKFQDSYSQVSIWLEIVSQQLLRGQWDLAEEALNSASALIFASENRRQEITHNLLWSKLWSMRGQKNLAIQFIRSARQILNRDMDRLFELKILIQEADVLNQFDDNVEDVKKSILALANKYGDITDQSWIERKGWQETSSSTKEDQIGSFIKTLNEKRSDKAFDAIVKSGFYSLIFPYIIEKPGRQLLMLAPGRYEVIAISNSGVSLQKVTKLGVAILLELKNGARTKGELMSSVWKYEYDPLRHDNLIYSSMSQLRKHLDSYQSWLINDESSYRFEVQILDLWPQYKVDLEQEFVVEQEVKPSKVSKVPSETSIHGQIDLNYRQLQVLDYLAENKFIDARTCREMFDISEITATRDLSALKNKGYVVRVGYGRAVRYSLGRS